MCDYSVPSNVEDLKLEKCMILTWSDSGNASYFKGIPEELITPIQ